MRKSFKVFVGHNKGGAGFRILASNMADVESVFNQPYSKVYAEEDAPDWLQGSMKLESDLYNQEPWLEQLISNLNKGSEESE